MTEQADAIVIGAGVVGLAVGRALARAGRDVLVLEKNSLFGAETSSRNSEVIHAGIYYRPCGLRARLCVEGKALLYAYCSERSVPHLNCEKIIVGFNGDEARLMAIKENAEANGVLDLTELNGADAAALEPELRCDFGLLSPSTGIVDSHLLMLTMQGDIEDAGGALVVNAPVAGGEVLREGIRIDVGGDEPISLIARTVVNCAGLWAEPVARSIAGLDPEFIPEIGFARGQYFTVSGRAPFSRLIYPMPAADSQGVHYTRDLGGQARLGPDIQWGVERSDYTVDETRRRRFFEEAQRFWPGLRDEDMHPGYAGIRPKSAGPGEEGDFRIDGPETHGVAGLVNLFGIESPGLTSCLAIADEVVRRLKVAE